MVALTGIERVLRQFSWVQFGLSDSKHVHVVQGGRRTGRYGMPTWCPRGAPARGIRPRSGGVAARFGQPTFGGRTGGRCAPAHATGPSTPIPQP